MARSGVVGGARRVGAAAWAVALCALVAACGLQSRGLREMRHTRLAGYSPTYSADVPPMVTFATVSLGGFRGVIADFLWLRASRMQEERRFVELVQLADWITKLEPHMAEVWVYHAWNMAYNVSVLMSRPEDRWRWVGNGIRLLRDEGVPLNSRNPVIYRELSWIFLHKLGMDGDTAAGYYRTMLAKGISPYLGDGGSVPAAGSVAAAGLAEVFKMDVAEMAELERKHGAIDWRVPCAHSLYWGAMAVRHVDGVASELVPAHRMVYTSLIEMSRRNGVLEGDVEADGYEFAASPNHALIDATIAYLEESMAASDFSGIRFAYVGFLRDAMRIRMHRGEVAEARALYGKLVDFFEGKNNIQMPTFEETLGGDDDLFLALLNSAGYY